jgi:hypothetical protein
VTQTARRVSPGPASTHWQARPASNADLLDQSQAWYQFHHLASRLDGRARTSNPRLPKPVRSRCATSRCTDGRTRTDTDGGLSAVPLPAGLRQRDVTDLPQCDGVADRTRTGFLRGHNPACRPLQPRPPSTREESNPRHPPREGGGLPLTYSSSVGRAGRLENRAIDDGESNPGLRVEGPAPCPLHYRGPVPSPFGHVDVAPPTGLEPVTFCSTGSCSGRLSYGGVVRALGLEPSLVRGKSPVPYQSGVTRVVGREGIEPPVSKDGWSTASCTHGATDPCRSQVALASTTMSLRLSRCGVPTGGRARRSRLGRSRTSGRRCWRPRHRRGSSPGGMRA